MTYSEQDIAEVHHAEDDVADLGLVEAIAAHKKHAREDVMSEHLPVVLATLLNVHNEQLLHPKAELHKVVPFHEAVHAACWEVGPHCSKVEPVLRLVHDVLEHSLVQLPSISLSLRRATYHSQAP